MPTLLQRSRMFQTPVALDRLTEAIRIVALEVKGEALAIGATQQQQQTYARRQAVAGHWQDQPGHWARVVGPSLSNVPALVDLAGKIGDETLNPTNEAAVDTAILAAVRLAVDDYLSKVTI